MTLPGKYPQANQTAQPRPQHAGGATFDHVEKLCLHTTETAGWPGYPTFAPHLTYNPWTHVWHQHFALTKSATTLADPSSTKLQENRDSVIQVEIVAYCGPKRNKPGTGIDYLDDQAVRDLADFAAWLHRYGDLELTLAPTWLPYPSSYGKSKARMSEATFNAFHGIHGHEHASGNDHGDPGAPPWLADFLRYAKAAAGQPINSTPTTGKALDMAAAEDVWTNFEGKQALKPGDNEIKISKDGDKTFVFNESPGVDILATIDVRTAKGERYSGRIVPNPDAPGEFKLVDQVESFFRVVSFDTAEKNPTPTTVTHERKPTTGDQVSFKGNLTVDKTKGRSARLRLVIRVPKTAPALTVEITSLQVSGWFLKKS